MTQQPDLEELQSRLQQDVQGRRVAAGAPRFPAAWQQEQAAFARAHSPRVAVLNKQRLKRLLYGLPVLGAAARLAAVVLRLPRRLERIDRQLAETPQLRAQIEARADARLELRLEALRTELLEQNHQRHMASQKLLSYIERVQGDVSLLRSQLRSAQASAAPVSASASSAALASASSSRSPAPAPAPASPLSAAWLDDFYWQFEERFRGSTNDITERLRTYVPYLQTLRQTAPNLPLLDIGCGRGEWIQLVQAQGLAARGVDLNARMVKECQAASLDVTLGDAAVVLQEAADDSLAAVTGFHIVEHIPFAPLMALFQEAYRAVAPGGLVLFETPNPENILVGACTFYTDPTHQNPIPPPTLGFMLNAVGFRRQDCLRLRSTPLSAVPHEPAVASVVARFHEGSDYAIVAFKDPLEL